MSEQNPILKNLNPKQTEAATTLEGPFLIIAGPGSGKTRTVTHRIAYMIDQGIDPKRILAVTFTNKAAEEMENRVEKLLEDKGAQIASPEISTFHSFCARVLRKEARHLELSSDFLIYDSKDSKKLIKEIMSEIELDTDTVKPKSVQKKINQAKNNLKTPDNFARKAGEFPETEIAKVYRQYQKRLEENNACDFSGLIFKVVRLFSNIDEVLEKYQQKYRYLMVDEYQDTNHAQYRLSYLLAKKYENIAVVGDDAQSVYGFRGADYQNILDFEDDWPDAEQIMLEKNYRSTQNILDAADCIISKNENQKDKKLWTEAGEGQKVKAKKVADEKKEAQFVISEISNLVMEEGYSLNDFAVLFRTNAQSRVLEEQFIQRNINYKIVGSVRFYERAEIKDILAYLRLLHNPHDELSLERIYNVPRRGLGKKTFTKAKNILQKKLCELIENSGEFSSINTDELNSRQQRVCNDFLELFSECQKQLKKNKNLAEFIDYVLDRIGYESYLKDKKDKGEEKWENITELLTVAKQYDNMSPRKGLEEFLEKVSLLSQADEVEENRDLVHLMTLHSAKGLEFSCVFIIGCEEGLFPHSRTLIDPDEVSEERRLCYVGLTRAKERVYLVYAKKRKLYGKSVRNPRSRFIDDIDNKLIEDENY